MVFRIGNHVLLPHTTTMSSKDLKASRKSLKKSTKTTKSPRTTPVTPTHATSANSTSILDLIAQRNKTPSSAVQSHADLLVALVHAQRADAIKSVEEKRAELGRELEELRTKFESVVKENEQLNEEVREMKRREEEMKEFIQGVRRGGGG